MVRSDAKTVGEYLAELAADRGGAIGAGRDVTLERLPEGYEESMQFGMIGYVVPLEKFPIAYNGQPLMYAALAAQRN